MSMTVNAGGNILLIGGEHHDLLGPLSQALTKADPGTLPVTPGYGQKNLDIIGRVRVHFCGPLAKGIGEKAFHFIQTDVPEFSIPARPQLDRIGSTVLSTALHLLR